MKRIIPHIRIENCKDEVAYYQDIFGGEIVNAQLADGIEMFRGHEGKYIHAELRINEICSLYFADTFGQNLVNGGKVLLGPDFNSEERIIQAYEKLAKDGDIQMELQDTFWDAKHAIVRDKNGISWELNYTK